MSFIKNTAAGGYGTEFKWLFLLLLVKISHKRRQLHMFLSTVTVFHITDIMSGFWIRWEPLNLYRHRDIRLAQLWLRMEEDKATFWPEIHRQSASRQKRPGRPWRSALPPIVFQSLLQPGSGGWHRSSPGTEPPQVSLHGYKCVSCACVQLARL